MSKGIIFHNPRIDTSINPYNISTKRCKNGIF